MSERLQVLYRQLNPCCDSKPTATSDPLVAQIFGNLAFGLGGFTRRKNGVDCATRGPNMTIGPLIIQGMHHENIVITVRGPDNFTPLFLHIHLHFGDKVV